MTQGKEVALRQRAITIRDYIQSKQVKEQIMFALPQYLNPDRFLRVAYTAITKNPQLLECTTESLLSAIIQAASLGLEPILGRAHLVPYKNRKKNVTEAQFQPGYQGLVDLIRRTGEVSDVWAEVIREADKWSITLGLERRLDHQPNYEVEDRGDVVGAYAVIKYKDGTLGWIFMPAKEIWNKHRARSQAYIWAEKQKTYDSPWHTDEDDMVKKTVLKKHSKLAPMSIEIQTAVAMDDAAETGISADVAFRDLLAAQGKEQAIVVLPEDEPPELEEGSEEEGEGEQTPLEKFLELSKDIKPRDRFERFVKACAEHYKKTPDEIRMDAVLNWDEFVETWKAWSIQEAEKEKKDKKADEDPDLALINSFKTLHAVALRNYWTANEETLRAASPAVQEAWKGKVENLASLTDEDRSEMSLEKKAPEKPKVATVVACHKCHKSMDIEDAHKVQMGKDEFFACEEHARPLPPPPPPKQAPPKDEYWRNVESDLDKWREEFVRLDQEDKFYQILGNHGATNIQEVITMGNKEAVQQIFRDLGEARYPKS